MPPVIPLVDYLVLEPRPHLRAYECTSCHARFFDRRNACGRCSGRAFGTVDVATEGEVVSFSIVEVAAPEVKVPFIAAIIRCDGTTVVGNLINVPPDPRHLSLGMPVRLTVYSLGLDASGVEAMAFGFEPLATKPRAGE